MQKHVNLVDLGKSFQTHVYLQNFCVDTAENEPLKVCQKIARGKNSQMLKSKLQKSIGDSDDDAELAWATTNRALELARLSQEQSRGP